MSNDANITIINCILLSWRATTHNYNLIKLNITELWMETNVLCIRVCLFKNSWIKTKIDFWHDIFHIYIIWAKAKNILVSMRVFFSMIILENCPIVTSLSMIVTNKVSYLVWNLMKIVRCRRHFVGFPDYTMKKPKTMFEVDYFRTFLMKLIKPECS